MKRIAIDMDEVMADTIGHFLYTYNSQFGTAINTDDLYGKHVFEVIADEHKTLALDYFQREDFFASIPVMPDSVEVIEALTGKYEVYITTAAMDVPRSFAAKFHWLQRHFPFISPKHIVFCGDKSIIAADYLIDDNLRQLTAFRGEGILYTAPHNVDERRFRRVNHWRDVEQMFLSSPD
jgi:5'(3')-deoxyribonucleotidase